MAGGRQCGYLMDIIVKRIAFDLDETLGVPLIEGTSIIGFQVRPGCLKLLERLRGRFTLVLWSVSNRRYLDRCLSFGLAGWFAETYSWDELPSSWKDVRRINADLLIDNSPHHREAAAKHGLADRYVVVPIYGGPDDAADPLAWVRLVERAAGLDEVGGAADERGDGEPPSGLAMARGAAVLIKVLEYVAYEADGWMWRSHEVPAPSWGQVEEAIRRLDRFRHPFLFLRLSGEPPNDERLEVLGGEGAWWVAGTVGRHSQRRLVNPDGGTDEVRVWTSDQGFADEERFVCKDIEVVLRGARHFAEHGDFDPSATWEEQGD